MIDRLTDSRNNARESLRRQRFARGAWQAKGAIALALFALLLPACNAYDREVAAPETGTSVERVADNPERLIGQTVTVTGEIQEIYSPTTFQIEDKSIFSSDDVMVVNATGAALPIAEGRNIRITGEVRQFILADFERDYDLTWDLNTRQKIEAEYRNKPVIVARTAQVLPD